MHGRCSFPRQSAVRMLAHQMEVGRHALLSRARSIEERQLRGEPAQTTPWNPDRNHGAAPILPSSPTDASAQSFIRPRVARSAHATTTVGLCSSCLTRPRESVCPRIDGFAVDCPNMMALPPPPQIPDISTVLGSNRVAVRLTGVNATSNATEFTTLLLVTSRPIEYRSERLFGPNEALNLKISVNFPSRKPLEMTAGISGFQGVSLHLNSPTVLEAEIQHSFSAKKKCHLLCFENGATSEGPCLTCPDGIYQVRICC